MSDTIKDANALFIERIFLLKLRSIDCANPRPGVQQRIEYIRELEAAFRAYLQLLARDAALAIHINSGELGVVIEDTMTQLVEYVTASINQ